MSNSTIAGSYVSKRQSASIAAALLDIFTMHGPPAILQCDNGREFSSVAGESTSLTESEMLDIIAEVKQLWPRCLMVNGRPRHSQSQGALALLHFASSLFIHLCVHVTADLNRSCRGH